MLRREAATWLARLQSGREPDVERKFRSWHDSDTRHAEAFQRVRRSYDQAGLLRHSAILVSSDETPIRKPEWKPRSAFAAAAAVAVLVLGAILLRGGTAPFGGTDAVMLTTRVGEIRQVRLADGSRVTLDTATRVDVDISRSRRTAHLSHGRARFQVVHADAPFVVETAHASISTREGVLDVEKIGEEGHVQVLAGAADLRGRDQSRAGPVALSAGEGATFSPGGAERESAVAATPDWTRGMLQFDGTPLADVVALANRYSERHIVLVGNLGALRVTGAFRAGDTAGLAKALAAAFSLSLQQNAGNLVLSSAASSNVQNKRGG
jgi:transmembrane sensor